MNCANFLVLFLNEQRSGQVGKKLSLLTLLLLPLTEAVAKEWTSIIKDAEHEVLVDIDSYNVSDNHPHLDAKIIYQTPQTFTLPDQKVQYSISINKFQYNCLQPIYRLRTIQLITKDKKLIDTIKISGGFNKLTADTDAFHVGQLTCQVHQMTGG